VKGLDPENLNLPSMGYLQLFSYEILKALWSSTTICVKNRILSCREVDSCSTRDGLFGCTGVFAHSDTQLHCDILFQDLCHSSVMGHDLHAIFAEHVLYIFFVNIINSTT
jgi:hypothetical protein